MPLRADRVSSPAPPASPAWRVLRASLCSRAVVLALAVASSSSLRPYDSSSRLDVPGASAGCALSDSDEPTPAAAPGGGLCAALLRLLAWDSLHLLRVAQCGYETEKSFAFFPLLPLLARWGESAARLACPPRLGARCSVALAQLCVTHASFCASAVALHSLGLAVTGDPGLALRAALFYAWTPAGPFASLGYAEPLFALLSFAGAAALEAGRPWRAAAALAAAAAARANGLLAAPLLAWHAARHSVAVIVAAADVAHGDGGQLPRRWLAAAAPAARRLLPLAAALLLRLCALLAPPAALQAWAYSRFCVAGGGDAPGGCGAAGAEPRPPPGAQPAWCAWRLPSVYVAAQGRYWRTGFMRYWSPEQAPNFGLAAPALLLAASGAAAYAAADPGRALALGLRPRPTARRPGEGAAAAAAAPAPGRLRAAAVGGGGSQPRRRLPSAPAPAPPAAIAPPAPPWPPAAPPPLRGYHADACLPYVAHWALLSLAALLGMHVEVVTRLTLACPALYWYAAHLEAARPVLGRLLWVWALAYTAVGTVLHCSFYPWT